MRNPITAAKQTIAKHKAPLAFIAGSITTGALIVALDKKIPFHHEFRPDQTAAEISAILEKAKAIDMSCPHGMVTLFASDYTE